MNKQTRKRYFNLTQCRSCKHDHGKRGCDVTLDELEGHREVDQWQMEQLWRNGYPRVDAEGCPGWEGRS